MNQQNERTDLQKRIAAELAEKSKKKALETDYDRPDGVTDSAYMKQTKQTSSYAWVWILLAVVVIGTSIWLVVVTS